MSRQVKLYRLPGDEETIVGAIFVDGRFICFSVENSAKRYPEGYYQMVLGKTGKTMPEGYHGQAYEVVDIPGRTVIKWHVANFFYQLEGCTAPNLNLFANVI